MSAFTRATGVLLALAAGLMAGISGSPQPALASDEVLALDLARWIRDRKPGLLVLDTRSSEQFTINRLPGARLLLGVDAELLGRAETVVLYGARNVDRDILDALGRHSSGQKYLRLRGGFTAWNQQVMFPALRADAPAALQEEFLERASLSRYFGGTPRRLEIGQSTAQARSRRGC